MGPCFDEGGGNVLMVSYSIPLRGKAGVLTMDLKVDYFARLWHWLKELDLGERSYGFVVNGYGATDGTGKDTAGILVNHPQYPLTKETRHSILNLPGSDPTFTGLARRILSGEVGRGTAIDPATGKRSTFLFTPVSSTGWSFVAVIPD